LIHQLLEHLGTSPFIVVHCLQPSQRDKLRGTLMSRPYALLLELSYLAVDLLRAEKGSVFFDLGQKVSVGEDGTARLVNFGEIIVLFGRNFVEQVTLDFTQLDHVIFKLAVAFDEVAIDLVEFGCEGALEIFEHMLDLFADVVKIPVHSFLFPFYFLFEIADVVLFLAQ
jgi:hypothetical protein